MAQKTATERLTAKARERNGGTAYVSYVPFVGFFLTIPDEWTDNNHYIPAQDWFLGRTEHAANIAIG